MKNFDSRITTLEILNNVAYVGLEGIDQLMAVNMQGDGLRRYLNIVAASANPMNNILLIDEIDKADIEFPNDLLRELDRMEFYCYETRERVQARHRPLVFITSNNEKELPDAFLRRCFFHYIRFPDEETMKKIVAVHFPDLHAELLMEAMRVFYALRGVPGLKKKPSTSELLDWLRLLLAEGATPQQVREGQDGVPPLAGALLKNEQDLDVLHHMARMAASRAGGLR